MPSARRSIAITSTPDVPPLPDVREIRDEIELARRTYHDLVDALSDDDWRRRANDGWTCGEIAVHLAASGDYGVHMTRSVRTGRGIIPSAVLPPFLLHWLSGVSVRRSARGADRAKLKAQFDAAMDRYLDELARADERAWSRGTRSMGDYHTLERLFRLPLEHVTEHTQEVRAALARPTN